MSAPVRLPGYWWGYRDSSQHAPEFSIVDLLQGHVLDSRVAAVCWSLVARRASYIVVGDYNRHTGKTSTATALTGFLPADTRLIVARGVYEDFSFMEDRTPGRDFVLVGEFSDHTPAYMWGTRAARVFHLTEFGYSFAGTMHAHSPEDMLQQLTGPPVSLDPAFVGKSLRLVLFLTAFREGASVKRRITSAYWPYVAPRGPGGLGMKSLVAWSPSADRWTLFSSEETWADLGRWCGLEVRAFRDEVALRQAYLEQLMVEAPGDFDATRERLLAFGASKM